MPGHKSNCKIRDRTANFPICVRNASRLKTSDIALPTSEESHRASQPILASWCSSNIFLPAALISLTATTTSCGFNIIQAIIFAIRESRMHASRFSRGIGSVSRLNSECVPGIQKTTRLRSRQGGDSQRAEPHPEIPHDRGSVSLMS
jgi:hypothetical protein